MTALESRPTPAADAPERLRRANRRTALTLASIALLFFVGIIATRYLDSSAAGIAAMGTAVLAFLVVAIGRNLLDR
jgi:O-antigen/teichoic acid export membrane protein